jgi:fibronectin-binding autotransporter adhesin
MFLFRLGGSLMLVIRILWASVCLLLVVPSASATVFNWDGGGSDTDVLTAANWVGDVAPSPALNTSGAESVAQLHFLPGVPSTITSTGNQLFGIELIFDPGAATPYTIGSTTTFVEIAMRNNGSIIDNQNTAAQNINLSFNTGSGSSTRVLSVKATAGDIVFNGGPTGSSSGFAYFGMTATAAASHRDFLLGRDITFSSQVRLAGVTPLHVYGLAGTATLPTDATGTLTLNGATGTANTNDLTTNFTGVVNLWSGKLKIGDSNALGRAANNTFIHGTFAASTSAVAQLAGGYEHGFGTLELYNNVSVGEALRIDSRIGDVADTDMLNNVSGANTLSNWTTQGGAGRFNFRSTSGTLSLTSTRAIHVSDGARSDNGGPGLVNTVYTFRGNGDFFVSSGIGQESGFGGVILGQEGTVSSLLRKQGAGTLTLAAAAGNDWDGGTLVEGGSIVVQAGGSFSTVGSRIHVNGGATLDASAISGLTLPTGKTLSGNGAVVGPLTAAGVLAPGGLAGLDGADALSVAAGVGSLSISSLVFNNGLSLDYQLNPSDTTIGAGINDLIGVSGLLDVSPAAANTVTLNVQNSGGGNFTGQGTWTLMTYGSLNPGSFDPSQITITGLDAGISGIVSVTGSNTVVLTTVPEPSALALVSLAALALGCCVRRRK